MQTKRRAAWLEEPGGWFEHGSHLRRRTRDNLARNSISKLEGLSPFLSLFLALSSAPFCQRWPEAGRGGGAWGPHSHRGSGSRWLQTMQKSNPAPLQALYAHCADKAHIKIAKTPTAGAKFALLAKGMSLTALCLRRPLWFWITRSQRASDEDERVCQERACAHSTRERSRIPLESCSFLSSRRQIPLVRPCPPQKLTIRTASLRKKEKRKKKREKKEEKMAQLLLTRVTPARFASFPPCKRYTCCCIYI